MAKSTRAHTYRWYEEHYGIPMQTLKRAAARGWPMDDTEKLLEKFMKAPGIKPPLNKLIALVDKDHPPKPSKKEPKQPEKTQDNEDGSNDSDAIYTGLRAELARLQEETNRSHREYLKETRPADKMVRQKVWLANVAALRQLAKEAPKADREAGNVLPISAVESAWTRAFKECKVSLESLGRRISTNKVFATLDPVDVEEVVNDEVVTILAHLESGSWLTKPQDK